MANGADATDSSDGQVLFSGLKGSLLNDSTSYMQSPVTSVEASEGFSSSGLVDANNFFSKSGSILSFCTQCFLTLYYICTFDSQF